MDPGSLIHRITISSSEPKIDPETLGYTPGDPKICSVRAAVKGMRASEGLIAGAERLNQLLQFTLRWRSGLDTSMVITWQGQDYDIEYIDPTPFERNYMRIRAIARGGVGSKKEGEQGG